MRGRSEIYAPLLRENSDVGVWVFYILFMGIVSIAFMNLVTAVIVNKAIAAAEDEREVRSAERRGCECSAPFTTSVSVELCLLCALFRASVFAFTYAPRTASVIVFNIC